MAELPKFTWTQTDHDITINMPVEKQIKGKDVVFNLTGSSLTLGIKGQAPVIDGELLNLTKPDDSTWELDTVDGQRAIKAVLLKAQAYRHWECILKTDMKGKPDDEDASAVKAMLQEWPLLKDLEYEDQKKMAVIRPQFEALNPETPRAELFRLITDINNISRKLGDDKKVCRWLFGCALESLLSS